MKYSYLVLLVVAVGCSKAGKSSGVDVSGLVTLDSKPLAGAEVKLISDKVTGFGRTGSEGKFQLVQGVPPGNYKVVISKIEGGEAGKSNLAPGEESLDQGQIDAIQMARETDPTRGGKAGYQKPKETVPPDFSSIQQTKLSLEVPPGGTTTADFKLTSQ